MNEILKKLAKGEPVTDKDLADALWEICVMHSGSCNDECPVYEKAGKTEWGRELRCDCFKDGKAMLAFLRRKS